MYLVADDDDAMVVAEVRQPAQRVAPPGDAGGVVRVTEHEHLGPVDDALEVVKVHFVERFPLCLLQRIEHHRAAVALDGRAEWVIHRRLDDDPIARCCERIDGEADAPDHARHIAEPFGADVPLVMVPYPALHHRPVVRRLQGIAKHRVLHPSLEGVHDEGRRLKIHVGHPERQQVTAPEEFRHQIQFDGARTGAVNRLVKVVCHAIVGYVCTCFPCKSTDLSRLWQACTPYLDDAFPLVLLRWPILPHDVTLGQTLSL